MSFTRRQRIRIVVLTLLAMLAALLATRGASAFDLVAGGPSAWTQVCQVADPGQGHDGGGADSAAHGHCPLCLLRLTELAPPPAVVPWVGAAVAPFATCATAQVAARASPDWRDAQPRAPPAGA